jgi:hypothetical protein
MQSVLKRITWGNDQHNVNHTAEQSSAEKRNYGVGRKLDISLLGADEATRERYRAEVESKFEAADNELEGSTSEAEVQLTEVLEAAAEAVLPEKPKRYNGRTDYFQDGELKKLSNRQKEIHRKVVGREGGTRGATAALQQERRELMKQIRLRVAKLREQSITRLAKELEATPDSRRKFEVTRILRRKSTSTFQLKNSEGLLTQSPPRLLEMVTEHFTAFFNPPGVEPIALWGGFGKEPLEEAITQVEVLVAMKKDG